MAASATRVRCSSAPRAEPCLPGVDVKLFAALTAETGTQLWRDWFEVIHEIEDLPMPTVFAAHALCLTAAFEISLACDLLLAAESARFGLVENVVGLTPSMGGPQRLASRAGPARARELVYSRRAVRRRDAGALERGQPGVARRRASPRRRSAFARGLAEDRPRHMRRRRRSSARRSRAAYGPPTT